MGIRVGIIGAGGMANGLLGVFTGSVLASQIQLVGIANRSRERAQALAQKYNCPILDMHQLAEESQILFFATSDNAIASLADQLAQELNPASERKIGVHCSGALTSQVLEPLNRIGWLVGSLHPLQSLTGSADSVKGLESCWYTLEGDKSAIQTLREIFQQVSGQVMVISPEQKIYYHAAACVVSNYLATLLDMGLNLFEQGGFTGQQGRDALWPLLMGTLNNIQKMGPQAALTGPVARGDWQTVERHMQKLVESKSNYTQLYAIMGKYTAQLAYKGGKIDKAMVDYIIQEILQEEHYEDSPDN